MEMNETRICQNCKKEFPIEPEDFMFYKKIDVPPPTFCPQCRFQRRLMFRNERTLYKRTCAKCGNGMITMIAPEKPYTVYCQACWWSDSWNPLDYGIEYDEQRPFFAQLQELMHKVPLLGLNTIYTTLVNSEYINEASNTKNCYLIFNSDFCENSLYGTSLTNTKDIMDAMLLEQSQLCYEVVNCADCFNAFFSEDLDSCHGVYFSKNLVGCNDCFGCMNLRNKSYHIWNQPYSKEEYIAKLRELKELMQDPSEIQKLVKESEAFWKKYPQKFMHGLQNKNVSGDYVYHSKNAHDIYQGRYVEDSRYCQFVKDASTKDSYDYTNWGMKAEQMYESITCGDNAQRIKFCVTSTSGSHDAEYSLYCMGGSSNIFGCVSARKKEYCILNKQYSKEEYEKLREKIIEDMQARPYVDPKGRVWTYGEFLPYEVSLFAYNETMALEYFPVSDEEAKSYGWAWRIPSPSEYTITKNAAELSSAAPITKDVLKEVIACGECGKAYRFVPAEIDLLNKFGLPLPRSCSECRHKRRFARLNPTQLWQRNCAKCNKDIQTSYAPGRSEIVYCEECYQAEVV